MPKPVHAPAGVGNLNRAFDLSRRFHVQGDHTLSSVFEEDVPEGAGPPRHIHH